MSNPLFICRSDGGRFDIVRVSDVISQLPSFGEIRLHDSHGRGRTILECDYRNEGVGGQFRIYDNMQSLVFDNSSEVELQMAILINQQVEQLQVPQLFVFDEMYSFCRLLEASETLHTILGKISTDPMKDAELASQLE